MGRLIVKFAIPCVISLVVNALYNIVDQIFIGWGVGYLGNGATNIVFPITIIALALAVLIGDGGAAYLSLKLGEGDLDSVKKGVGNAAVMITIAGIAMLVITIVFMNPILTLFGATDVLRPAALEYGYVIAIGLPFTMISTALNAMIRADGSPNFAMVSMLLGAIINTVFDPIFIFIFDMGVRGAAIATILGQIISFLVSIFYLPRFKTFHFDPLGAASAQARLSERPQSGCQQLHHPDCKYHRDGTFQQPARRLRCGFGLRLRDYRNHRFLYLPVRTDERGLDLRLRGRSVQRICGQVLPHLPHALPAQQLPDRRRHLLAGNRQAHQVGRRHAVPTDRVSRPGRPAAAQGDGCCRYALSRSDRRCPGLHPRTGYDRL